MEWFLLILKVGAVAVSGLLVILDTKEDFKRNQTWLAKIKKRALPLAVLGVVLALSAELISDILQKQKDDASDNQTKQILTSINTEAKLANKSLIGIKRITTRFNESITVDVMVEIPQSNPMAAHLTQVMKYLEPDNLLMKYTGDHLADRGIRFLPPPGSEELMKNECESNIFEFNPDAYIDVFNDASRFESREGQLRLEEAKSLLWIMEHPKIVIAFTKTPMKFEVFHSRFPALNDGDLFFAFEKPNETHFYYTLPSGRIFFRWKLNAAKERWHTDEKITSLYDVVHAYGYSEICSDILEKRRNNFDGIFPEPDWVVNHSSGMEELFAHLKIIKMSVGFDNYNPISLKQFKSTGVENIVESFFPDEDQILGERQNF